MLIFLVPPEGYGSASVPFFIIIREELFFSFDFHRILNLHQSPIPFRFAIGALKGPLADFPFCRVIAGPLGAPKGSLRTPTGAPRFLAAGGPIGATMRLLTEGSLSFQRDAAISQRLLLLLLSCLFPLLVWGGPCGGLLGFFLGFNPSSTINSSSGGPLLLRPP